MFKKILIANRGEIACRIIRTAKRLGICCVAVYSEADADSLHVKMADEAYCIGPPPSRDSYLNYEKILAIAKAADVEAIHPGYGFLAENAQFAQACAEQQIIFIGPSAAAIDAMGSKINAKKIMQAADVPITPSYYEDTESPEKLLAAADKIGYPVLLKAAAGGGGKGMRIVHHAEELAAALASAKREALASFGDDKMLLEKYLPSCRHIEVQVFADQHGNFVYLFERDCSIQRRYQKIIEEAPAPKISEELRRKLGAAAIAAAKAIHYTNAGTIEFLLADNDEFYFMEMNTRLQVEHAITEMITGQDLVEWQLRIALGEKLPLQQEQLHINGHAFEARIYAEDPSNDFLPSTGKLVHWQMPKAENVRIDSGFCAGDAVSVYYDPLLAKLIVWGEDRLLALKQLHLALADFQVVGVTTNLPLLSMIISTSAFLEAKINTHFIADHQSELFNTEKAPSLEILSIASLYLLLLDTQQASLDLSQDADLQSPWLLRDHWRLNDVQRQQVHFKEAEEEFVLSVVPELENNKFGIFAADQYFQLKGELQDRGRLLGEINGVEFSATVVTYLQELHLFIAGHHYTLHPAQLATSQQQTGDAANHLQAPMPGTVSAVMVHPGQAVKLGENLLVIEAMKMEHTIRAPAAGRVKEVFFKVGDLVAEGALLVEFE